MTKSCKNCKFGFPITHWDYSKVGSGKEWKDNGHCSMKVALEALPSAEAPYMFSEAYMKQLRFERDYLQDVVDGQWIPCSERLPEKRRSVLITTSEGFVGEACYWETTENHVIWKGYRWNATYWDDEVLAWMPLPKPYRENGEA